MRGGAAQKEEWSTNWSTCREPGPGSTNQVARTLVNQPKGMDWLLGDKQFLAFKVVFIRHAITPS